MKASIIFYMVLGMTICLAYGVMPLPQNNPLPRDLLPDPQSECECADGTQCHDPCSCTCKTGTCIAPLPKQFLLPEDLSIKHCSCPDGSSCNGDICFCEKDTGGCTALTLCDGPRPGITTTIYPYTTTPYPYTTSTLTTTYPDTPTNTYPDTPTNTYPDTPTDTDLDTTTDTDLDTTTNTYPGTTTNTYPDTTTTNYPYSTTKISTPTYPYTTTETSTNTDPYKTTTTYVP